MRFREDRPEDLDRARAAVAAWRGTWEARIPEPTGETVTTRYTLRELPNRLDELTEKHQGQP